MFDWLEGKICVAFIIIFVFVSLPTEESESQSTSSAVPEAEESSVPLAAPSAGVSAVSSIGGEQTTLVHNEEEAFALEPLDITHVPGGDHIMY